MAIIIIMAIILTVLWHFPPSRVLGTADFQKYQFR